MLRFAVRQSGLPAMPDTAMRRIFDELIPAREDAEPLVAWKGAEARRYRGCLYLLTTPEKLAPVAGARLSTESPELMMPGLGALRLCGTQSTGIDEALLRQGLDVRFRTGGETLCPVGYQHRRKLKKLLQESGIVPWMRDRIPLLYAGDSLVAVGDLWVDAHYASPDGTGVCWDRRPAIH